MTIYSDEDGRNLFRPFTLKTTETNEKERPSEESYLNEGNAKLSSEDEFLREKSLLPPWIDTYITLEHFNTPLEDIDPFYTGRKTFVVITRERQIFRFDATDVLWVLDPLNPIRRLAISILTHWLFNLIMIAVIIANCFLVILSETATIHTILLAFTAIYTIEVIVKITARGFILRPFTYLRNPCNCLNFVLTLLAYTPIGPDVGGFAVLRGLCLHEAPPFTKYAPGIETIIHALKESVKYLAIVMVLVVSFVFLFALFGLHYFKGMLTQKCIANFPEDGSSGNLTDENWTNFVSNSTNWFVRDYTTATPVCSNFTGGGTCEEGYVCLEGYGTNPNNGFTSFDTFGWACFSAFQLLTRDHWENLYRLVLRAGGQWEIAFFIAAIFCGSYYLQALIFASVSLAYHDAQRKAEEASEYRETLRRLPHADDSNPTTPVIEEDLSQMNDTFTGAVNKEKTNFLCCSLWEKFRHVVRLVICNPFVIIFYALCIIVDLFLMTLYYHGMSDNLRITLESANYFFTVVFASEVIMNIIEMHPKRYFQEKSNVFEFAVITSSVLELSFGCAMISSVLRTFRLLKLIKSVESSKLCVVKVLLSCLEAALTPLINLTLVFSIILIVFAKLGMRLFGNYYIENAEKCFDSELPRRNFTNFMHSLMIVFTAFCGRWIESMRDCMLIGDITCLPFFLTITLFGRFVIINLFPALVLDKFGANPFCPQRGNKIKEAIEHINRTITRIKSKRQKLTDRVSFQTENEPREMPIPAANERPTFHSALSLNGNDRVSLPAENEPQVMALPTADERTTFQGVPSLDGNLILEGDRVPFPAENEPQAMPPAAAEESPLLEEVDIPMFLNEFEKGCFLETKYFQITVRIVIIISTLALALEDVNLQHRLILQQVLHNLHIIITVSFLTEMLMKWWSFGLRKYFHSALCLLDFIVVVCCLINLITPLCGYQDMRVLRTVRILRILRVIPMNIKHVRIVIKTLISSVPWLCSALCLCLIIWLPFAILGVRLFAGKYFKCVDTNETRISFEKIPDLETCLAKNYTWLNSHMNFDNLGNAYLSLLQVATFAGWTRIVNDAIDSRELNQQPIRDANIYVYIYFVVFVVICSFFTPTVFTGVISNSFSEQVALSGGRLIPWIGANVHPAFNVEIKIESCKPIKAIPLPKWKVQAKIYELVQSKVFEMIFFLVIGLNMLILTMDHYPHSEIFGTTLQYISLISLIIFTFECALKMFAFRHHYFKDMWNLFDLAVVSLSFLALVLPDAFGLSIVTISLLRIIRVANIDRLLRQLKCAKNIRNLMFFTSACFSTLLYIILLLFGVVFIFAIFGMSFFMHVKEKSGLDDVFNFKTFGQSLMVLIQVSTSAGWDGVLNAITNEENCDAENCGDSALGVAFLLSYLFITYLVLTMFIPAVSSHYSKLYDPDEFITDDDYAMFIETWQQFEPVATGCILLARLPDFLDALEPPFRIPKPSKIKIASLEIPITKDERVYFTDVLEVVIEEGFVRRDLWYDHERSYNSGCGIIEYVSTTLRRQHETHCARVIQKFWRNHKNRQCFGLPEDNEKPMSRDTSVTVETDGNTTKNGHKTILYNRTPTSNLDLRIAYM